MRTDHRVDDLGNGEPLAIAGRDVFPVASDSHPIADGEHFLQAVRNIEHGGAVGAQLLQNGE